MPRADVARRGSSRLLLGMALLCLSGARGQGGSDNPVIGVDICACQPATYEFVLDFDLTCQDRTVGGPGINDTACVVNTEQQVNVTDYRPVRITTIQILELNQDLRVIAQTPINGDFRDGDSFRYTSVIASIDPSTEDPEMIPKGLQITLGGRNAEEEDLVNFFLIIYDNNCGVFPVVLEGQQIGWTIFNDLGIPPYALCPAIGPLVPSVAPHPSLRPSPSSSAPTRHCIPRPLPKKKAHPSGSGSKGHGSNPSKGHGSKLSKPKASGSEASKGKGSKSAHLSKGSKSQASKAAISGSGSGSGSGSWNHTDGGSTGWISGSGSGYYNDTDINDEIDWITTDDGNNSTDDDADGDDSQTDDGDDSEHQTDDGDDILDDDSIDDESPSEAPAPRLLEEGYDFVMQNIGPHSALPTPHLRSPSLSPLYYSSSSSSKGSYSQTMSGSKAYPGSKGASKHVSKSKSGSGSHDPKTGLPYCDASSSSKAGSSSKASKGGSYSKSKGKGGSTSGGSASGGSGGKGKGSHSGSASISKGSGSIASGSGGKGIGKGSYSGSGSGSIPHGIIGSNGDSSGNLTDGSSGTITSGSAKGSGSGGSGSVARPHASAVPLQSVNNPWGYYGTPPALQGDSPESGHETSQHNIFGGHERNRRKD